MNRRRVVQLGAAACAALLLGGHTPYGQWVVYRKKHLLIGCHKADPPTYELARRAVALLEEHLPAAKARVARAPDAGRLASLLATGQMDIAIVDAADARAMLAGAGAFAPYGAIDLRLLGVVGERLLVARGDFPDRHARLVAAALIGTELAPARLQPHRPAIPWHPGSPAAYGG